MAKINDPSGEVVVRGSGRDLRPSQPPRHFPYRLLLWALLMTGAAGAGGYFSYRYYNKAHECEAASGPNKTLLEARTTELAAKTTEAQKCSTDLAALTTSTSEMEKQLQQATKDMSATKEELTTLRAQRAEAEKRMDKIEKIHQEFSKMISAGELTVKSRRGNLVVALPSEVLFPSASAQLSRKGEVAVLQVGGVLKQFADRRFLVVGHTDNQPLKSTEHKDNWELSVARALTVTRYLVEAGMKPENLVASGVGEHDPVSDNKSNEGRAKNRRIEIVLLPALSELPPLPPSLEEAGKKAEDAAKKGK